MALDRRQRPRCRRTRLCRSLGTCQRERVACGGDPSGGGEWRGVGCERSEQSLELSTLEPVCESLDALTDEIVLKASQAKRTLLGSSRRWKSLAPLTKYVGKELGWCCTARNYKGYADLFILSFQGIEPQIVFCGIASNLWIYRMKRM